MAFKKNHQEEWSKTGTSYNKPDEGWIHSSEQLETDSGVCYNVRYVGCMPVIVSMKTLQFETRTFVARESICRVAEAAGFKSASKRKKDKKALQYLSDHPDIKNGGKDVTLIITTDHVSILSMDTGDTLLNHSMEEISFASGGDAETVDFVAYVAKDSANNRACHVLECGGGVASQVILTIAQAFELRYKQMLKKKKQPVVVPDREFQDESAWGDEEPTYYNDDATLAAARSAADVQQPPPIPPLPDHYSARPSNLCLAIDGEKESAAQLDDVPSPLYENTKEKAANGGEPSSADYCLANELNSPQQELWYHGKLSRKQAERMLICDGDFLVRESTNKEGQYVLSGMKSGIVVHLLLVDPEGVVRTKDRTFDNVSHLISYHRDNRVPILSQDIELYLANPVVR